MLRASAGALVRCRALEQQRRQREASVLDYIFTGRKRVAASVVFDRYTATARQLLWQAEPQADSIPCVTIPSHHHLVIYGLGCLSIMCVYVQRTPQPKCLCGVVARSSRNGPETDDVAQRRFMYLHEGGAANPANVYAQILHRYHAQPLVVLLLAPGSICLDALRASSSLESAMEVLYPYQPWR